MSINELIAKAAKMHSKKWGIRVRLDSHPVCREIKKFIGLMNPFLEIYKHFFKAPYGWSKDVIDGALFTMLAAGVLKASDSKT